MNNSAIQNLNQGPEHEDPTVASEEHVSKLRACDDSHAESVIKATERLIKKLNHEFFQNRKKYQETREESYRLLVQSWVLQNRHGDFSRTCLAWMTQLLDHLYEALNQLKSRNTKRPGRAVGSCSSGQLNACSLRFRLIHGSNSLAAERMLLRETNTSQQLQDVATSDLNRQIQCFHDWIKSCTNYSKWKDEQIFREINQLEKAREKAVTNAASRGKILDPLSSTRAIENEIVIMKKIAEEIRKENLATKVKIKSVEKYIKDVEKLETLLWKQADGICHRKDEAEKCFPKLKKRRDKRVVLLAV